ncbi:MAG TPA: hypothetical protein P5550_10395 [Bacteroidales bacterium]|nr:hypothetical protein [Bacteroidales bacterium]HRZ75959.1 hypothetical protein [Bacteroidales bacterium]
MDFTPACYLQLLQAFRARRYTLLPFGDYMEGNQPGPLVVLRHDVDRHLEAALNMAEAEAREGLRATYNFRIPAFRRHADLVRAVHVLGHEVGYHYEELSACRGRASEACRRFALNLDLVRSVVPVRTLAMHGSPLSRHDNRHLWQHMDYRDFGLIGEPYMDIRPGELLYLTDTGRRWNDQRFNLRDHLGPVPGPAWSSTPDLIASIRAGQLPQQVMLNVHPGRWNPPGWKWMREWAGQWARNLGKLILKTTLTHARQHT